MKKDLHYFAFRFSNGKVFYQLSIGERIWERSPTYPPTGKPEATIDIFYDDYKAYRSSDLLAAIERATASHEDVLFEQICYGNKVKKTIGRVALLPRAEWQSKEFTLWQTLSDKIDSAIKKENAFKGEPER